eukprot:3847878-Prymnesium_polylepis.2
MVTWHEDMVRDHHIHFRIAYDGHGPRPPVPKSLSEQKTQQQHVQQRSRALGREPFPRGRLLDEARSLHRLAEARHEPQRLGPAVPPHVDAHRCGERAAVVPAAPLRGARVTR